jgi:outer membrane protein assembly factor BamB
MLAGGLLALGGLGACQFGTRPSAAESATAPGSHAAHLPGPPPGQVPHAPAVLAQSAVDGGAADGATAAPGSTPIGAAAPMYRGDAQHTGRSPFTLPDAPPQERWRFPTGGNITAAPAVASDGTIVVGSHDGFVYAVSPQGTPRWRHRTADMIWATPALAADGTIYIGSDDDHLYALSAEDGAQKWALGAGACKRRGGRSPEGARCDIDQVTLAADGTIYIGGDGIYAVRSDGTVRWHFDPNPPTAGAPGAVAKRVHCGSAPSVGRGGMVYAICQEMVYALGPDGIKRWEFAAQGELEAAPAIGEGGIVYLGSDDRRLYALDVLGQPRFAFTAGAPIRTAVALGPGGAIYFGCDDESLYSLRADGTLLWTFHTAGAVRSSPVVDAAGSVVFGSRDDRLYAVAADGKQKWSVVLDGDVDGTPALGADGTIYVGADDQALHALR